MNRSILIVICDFLLLSLLTFSTDMNHMADESTPPPTKVVVTPNPVANPGNDLTAVMKQALEEARRNQEQIRQQLAEARSRGRPAADPVEPARTGKPAVAAAVRRRAGQH